MARDKIVIFATHVVSDVEFIAKEIMVIKSGELLYKAPIPELLKCVENKVFEVCADEQSVHKLQERYRVSNLSQEAGYTRVRIVNDDVPEYCEYTVVKPNLEDFYIYVFEDKTV